VRENLSIRVSEISLARNIALPLQMHRAMLLFGFGSRSKFDIGSRQPVFKDIKSENSLPHDNFVIGEARMSMFNNCE